MREQHFQGEKCEHNIASTLRAFSPTCILRNCFQHYQQIQTTSQEPMKLFHADPELLFFLSSIYLVEGRKKALTGKQWTRYLIPHPRLCLIATEKQTQYQAQQLNSSAVNLFSLKQRILNATDDTQLLPKAPKYQVRDWTGDKESLILLYLPVSRKP